MMKDDDPKLPKRLMAKHKKFGGRKELAFKRWLRAEYEGRVDAIEPAFGSTTGLADLFFVWGGRIIPVELKVGEFDYFEMKIICSTIRSDQMNYHADMRLKHVPTVLLVDCGAHIGILSNSAMDRLHEWKEGFKISPSDGVSVMERDKFKRCLNKGLFFSVLTQN